MLSTHEHQLVDGCLAPLSELVDIKHPNTRISEELFSITDHASSLTICDHAEMIATYPLLNNATEAHIVIAQISTSIRTGRMSYAGVDPQVIGIKKLHENFAHILIRQETFVDRLAEIFRKTEIDFKEYPEFCKKYFYMSSDVSLGRKFATPERITLISDADDLILEVIGDNLIMRFPRVITKDDCEIMVRLLMGI